METTLPYPSTRRLILLLLVLLTGPLAAMAEAQTRTDTAELTRWISEMKQAPRGPFERIRWFCKDGTILPPGPYACAKHGGGIQHGELNERARQLQAAGYPVGTVLAALGGSPTARCNSFAWRY